jgi:glutathione S-transferase
MKLIYAQGACSLAVHILLEEMKVDYETIKVSLKDKTILESYNPKSYVPVLILNDGTVMTEATSILQYLCHEYGSAYLPEDGMARAKCIEWLTYVSTELHKGATPLFFRETLPTDFIQQAEHKIYKRLQFLEDQLQDQAFIINNNYTIADMYALAILRILSHVGIDIDRFSEINNYKQNLESSATIKKVLQKEASEEIATEPNQSFSDLHIYYRSETFSEVRKQ